MKVLPSCHWAKSPQLLLETIERNNIIQWFIWSILNINFRETWIVTYKWLLLSIDCEEMFITSWTSAFTQPRLHPEKLKPRLILFITLEFDIYMSSKSVHGYIDSESKPRSEFQANLWSLDYLPSGSCMKWEMVWFYLFFQLQLNSPNRPIRFELFCSTEHENPWKVKS